jgi:hypothetical protein
VRCGQLEYGEPVPFALLENRSAEKYAPGEEEEEEEVWL